MTTTEAAPSPILELDTGKENVVDNEVQNEETLETTMGENSLDISLLDVKRATNTKRYEQIWKLMTTKYDMPPAKEITKKPATRKRHHIVPAGDTQKSKRAKSVAEGVDKNRDCDNNIHYGECGKIMSKAENVENKQKGLYYDEEGHIQWIIQIILGFSDVSGQYVLIQWKADDEKS
jgi:hypothetical protein